MSFNLPAGNAKSNWLRNAVAEQIAYKNLLAVMLLKGDRAEQYSMRINNQWRICFRWTDGDVIDVEIVHYH